MHVCGRVGILEIFFLQELDRLKQAAVKDEFSGHKYQCRTGRDDPNPNPAESQPWAWLCRPEEKPLVV